MFSSFRIYNTISRKVELFNSINPGTVKLYTCGPTVYNFAHIGNLRTFMFEDMLCRVLAYLNFTVVHVMNITDVGHLQFDSDAGDDKINLASHKENKSPWELAEFYKNAFFLDCYSLNIKKPVVVCRATEHILDMQQMILGLLSKRFAYIKNGNVYFRISALSNYGKLSKIVTNKNLCESRVEFDPNKENQLDFVLWFSVSKFKQQIMQWDSPWGRGFPGWHIECSAMASKYLGSSIDIHCGGIDHISVHHTNEIAQSESYFGHQWVNYWMHGEFLTLSDIKMSKSKENFFTLDSIRSNGFLPVHFRYLCLETHYRSQLQFNFTALERAANSFKTLRNKIIKLKKEKHLIENNPTKCAKYLQSFNCAIKDDLNIPLALSILWVVLKDKALGNVDKLFLFYKFNKLFGLNSEYFQEYTLSAGISKLIDERIVERNKGNWNQADNIRHQLLRRGILLTDTRMGNNWEFN